MNSRLKLFALILLYAILAVGCGTRTSVDEPSGGLSLNAALALGDTLSLPGLDAGEQAQLREAWRRGVLSSGRSRITSAAPQLGPSDLTVTANGDGTATLSWTYANKGDYNQDSIVNISDLTPLGAFLGETSTGDDWTRAQVADGDGNNVITINDITALGGSYLNTITAYVIEVNSGTAWSTLVEVPFSASTIPDGGGRRTFSYVVGTPEAGASYRVTGTHGTDVGAPSNAEPYLPGQLDKVQNVTATQGTDITGVDLSWDAFTGADHYAVERGDSAAGPFTFAADNNAGETTWRDTAAAPGTHYWYRVTAEDSAGSAISTASDPAEGWSADPLSPPQNLAATDNVFDDKVSLTWDSVANAAQYRIFRSTTPGSGHTELTLSAVNFYDDDSVVPGLTYYYYVVAENAVSTSDPSAEDSGSATLVGGAPVIDGVTPASGESGAQVTFAIQNSGGAATTYDWNFGGAGFPGTSTEAMPTVLLDAAGTYTVSVTASNAGGSDSFDFQFEVTPAPPTITGASPSGGITGTDVQFSASVSGDGPFSYSWNFGGGATPNTSSEESPTVTLGAEGTYDVLLEVSNGAGMDSFGFQMSIDPVPIEDELLTFSFPDNLDSSASSNVIAIVHDDPRIRRVPDVIIDVVDDFVVPEDITGYNDLLKLSGQEFELSIEQPSDEVFPRITVVQGSDPEVIDASTVGEAGIIVVDRNPGRILVDVSALPDPSPGDQAYAYKLFNNDDSEAGSGTFTIQGLFIPPTAPTCVAWGVDAFDREDIPLEDRHYDNFTVSQGDVATPTPPVLWVEFNDGSLADFDGILPDNNVRLLIEESTNALADYEVALDVRVAGINGMNRFIAVYPLKEIDFFDGIGPGNLMPGMEYTLTVNDANGADTYAQTLTVVP
jgi:PKD repeat protein